MGSAMAQLGIERYASGSRIWMVRLLPIPHFNFFQSEKGMYVCMYVFNNYSLNLRLYM
jgi:hypothetical protein